MHKLFMQPLELCFGKTMLSCCYGHKSFISRKQLMQQIGFRTVFYLYIEKWKSRSGTDWHHIVCWSFHTCKTLNAVMNLKHIFNFFGCNDHFCSPSSCVFSNEF